MLKLSKKVEYAIIALKYIALNSVNGAVTVRAIADSQNISFELLSKVLQKLKQSYIVESFQGVTGGYSLSKSVDELSLSDIISAVESNIQITDCMKEHVDDNDCEHFNGCSIRDPLLKIQADIVKTFRNTKLRHIL